LLAGVHSKVMVFETLTVSDSIRACIASNAASDAIVKQAVAEGMKTLRQRALEVVMSH
jgi:type II secretory ATPase GspE/PulE/Tfp pilus assembly ATPase PilB-like protein